MYKYRDKLYFKEADVDEAICEEIGGNYNNIDPQETLEFEYEWQDVERVDKTAWGTFVEWCKQVKLKPQYASSVERYFKEKRNENI